MQQQQDRHVLIAHLPNTPEVNALAEAAGFDGFLIVSECYTAMLALKRAGVTGWAAMQMAVAAYLQSADEARAAATARKGRGMPHYHDRPNPIIEANKAAQHRRLKALAHPMLPGPITSALSAVMPGAAA